MVRNEGPYLAEWLEYHLLVGVEKFWIVNNNSTDNTSQVLSPYVALGIVRLTVRRGQYQQKSVYNSVIPTLRHLCYWVALIDVDEFLVPVNTHHVPEVLRAFEGSPAVTVDRVIYGSNKKGTMERGLVIERFTKHVCRDAIVIQYPKAIVNPRMFRNARDRGHAYLNNLAPKNALGRLVAEDLGNQAPIYEGIRLNHYWIKSDEEFLQRGARGITPGMAPNEVSQFMGRLKGHIKSVHDIVQDPVMDWAIPLVKANIAKRLVVNQ